MFFNKKNKTPFIPVGVTEFNIWVDQVVAHTRLPLNDSVRFAVSAIVIESSTPLSIKECALKLETGACKQVAASVFQEIKQRRIDEDQKTTSEVV